MNCCKYCGRPITLVRTGVHMWKWLTKASDLGTWKCAAPDFPVRSHEPERKEAA